MGWSNWIFIDGPSMGITGAPATISRNSNVANVYVRGGDNALWQRAWFNGTWHDWQRHDDGGVLASRPAAGSLGPNQEHVFVRGTDNQVWQKWWVGGSGWSNWIPLGAPNVGFVGAPSTISRNSSVANIYVRGTDNSLWQKAWFDGTWHDWQRHDDGAELASEIAVGSMGPNHEHVFALGTDGQVWQKWWVGGIWSGWVPLGNPAVGINGSPVTISRNGSVANIYVRGNDNALWQKAFFNNAWGDWQPHEDGGVLASEPAAGSLGPNQEHVFAVGTDGNVWQKWWLGGTRAGEIVVFLVRSIIPTLNGCSAYPAGEPGAVISQFPSPWTLAHEIGHVLGLQHLAGENCQAPGYVPTSLMTGCGTGLITVSPPSLSASEVATMIASPLMVRR